jgi:hypothetical protein
VAHDFFGRPVPAIGPAGEDGVALALDRRGKLVGGAGEALHALLVRLLGVVFDRQHRFTLLGLVATGRLVWHRRRGSKGNQLPRR